MTINILANPLSKATELARPGHIFPLIAKDGGTLVRTGHTEGSVDLCRLAGLQGCGVICEIIKDDGEMARRDDLDLFSEKHNLKTVFISDIVEYRLANEILVKATGEEEVEFFGINAQKRTFVDHEGLEHTAISFHHIGETANVKVHNIVTDMELLLDQGRYKQLIDSITYLKLNGGVLIFINNPDQSHSTIKEFGVGAQILKLYGIAHMRLLTCSTLPEFVGLSGFGLEVLETINPSQE
jgi:3,4-dihydroxy 2-butanone 4-phosphate synthase/GTP cyclohydrolase II